MPVTSVFRSDPTNVGDWYCSPARYFPTLTGPQLDILSLPDSHLEGHVVLGGGGLIAATFAGHMEALAAARPTLRSLAAWGIGESLHVDRNGGFVSPFEGPMPDYLKVFDLVGVRDFGTEYRWVPCASCMLDQFDRPAEATQDIVIYEHKRIPIPIDGFARMTNGTDNIDAALEFLASSETVITNSYHGAYWAALLGRRVIAIPNMSKLYRLKHAPVITRPEHWKRALLATNVYPEALAECRSATLGFFKDVEDLHHS